MKDKTLKILEKLSQPIKANKKIKYLPYNDVYETYNYQRTNKKSSYTRTPYKFKKS